MPSFFFNDAAPPEIYPLSLHAALPILDQLALDRAACRRTLEAYNTAVTEGRFDPTVRDGLATRRAPPPPAHPAPPPPAGSRPPSPTGRSGSTRRPTWPTRSRAGSRSPSAACASTTARR